MRVLPHPLEQALAARVSLLATTLSPHTIQNYRHTVRLFLMFLQEQFPEIRSAGQLRRDPHILGFLEYLWKQKTAFTGQQWHTNTRGAHLIRLRKLFGLLADHPHPPRPGLLWSEDIPRFAQPLPRPLNADDDLRLKDELRRRNDWQSNALLLTRLTGMRPGETMDLTLDCLHHSLDDRWLLRVPPVKANRERWVPIDDEVRAIVARLTFLRTLSETAAPRGGGFLLPRPEGRNALGDELRKALACFAVKSGITSPIVPYQLRHTFATTMLRAGISLPALMKLLGHRTANVTLRYVEITQQDVQREFELAQARPRHLVPIPLQQHSIDPQGADAEAVIGHLSTTIRVLELYRQQNGGSRNKSLQLLARRLARVRSGLEKMISG